jgi:hypothetical protein
MFLSGYFLLISYFKIHKMKKLTIIFFLTFIFQLNWAADLIVTTSGQTGTYTTLSSALVAANSGDRILISNIITLYENDTIDKSVTILPLNSGSRFIMVGSITVKAEANTEIRIVGMELTGEVKSISGSADGNNLCQFYMIDCEIVGGYNINCDVSGLSLNLMYSNMPNLSTLISFRQGKLIANNINGYFQVLPGDNINYADTTFIVANRIYGTSDLDSNNLINNSDHYFLIANNYFGSGIAGGKRLEIRLSNLNSSGENNIINNTMNCSSKSWGTNIVFNKNYTHNNTSALNNILLKSSPDGLPENKHIGNGFDPIDIPLSLGPKLVRNNVFLFDYSGPKVPQSTWTGVWYNVGASGVIIDSLNYLNSVPSNVTAVNIDVGSINNLGSGKQINDLDDIGENFPKYYDINLTRNDPGTYGGPYSWDNYWNTNNGKARIYELDAPFELPPNQTFNIKSSASHNH